MAKTLAPLMSAAERAMNILQTNTFFQTTRRSTSPGFIHGQGWFTPK